MRDPRLFRQLRAFSVWVLIITTGSQFESLLPELTTEGRLQAPSQLHFCDPMVLGAVGLPKVHEAGQRIPRSGSTQVRSLMMAGCATLFSLLL